MVDALKATQIATTLLRIPDDFAVLVTEVEAPRLKIATDPAARHYRHGLTG